MKLVIVKRVLWTLVFILLLVLALFAAGVLWPLDRVEPVRTQTPVAIVDVAIVDAQADRLVPRQTVIVDNGRIETVGKVAEVNVPPNARVVDGADRFLIPALWDMHTHVYAVSPLLDMPLYIAFGVTNVRDMQGCPKEGDPFIACPEDQRRWTQEAVAGKRVGPRIQATASFMANGPGMQERLKDVPAFFDTGTPEQARAFVRHYAGRVDQIKVYNGIPRPAYLALADETARLGLDLVGHRPHAVSAIEAARHQKSIEHARFLLHESFSGSAELRALAGTGDWHENRRRMLDEHDPDMAQAIFEAMKREGAWYVPTHLTRWVDAYADHPSVREDPNLSYLHPLMQWQWLEDVNKTLARAPSPQARQTYRDFYEKGLELTGAAHRAGVKVLAGTDYLVAGVDLHRELEQLVRAGLSPAEALHAATLAPARYFDLEHRYGTVAEGKVADLVLLRDNPLKDIRHTRAIESVIFNGNLYDRAAIKAISEQVKTRAGSWAVGARILWRFLRNPVAY